MLDWLKTILGDSYSEEIEKKISAEIGRQFVSRADFNAKSEALKKAEEDLHQRDGQLEELKKSTGDADALKQQITSLQNQNAEDKKKYDAEIARIRLDGAVDAALTAAGARNNTAVKALLADSLKDAVVGDDGVVKGLSEAIEKLSKDDGTSFLFASASGAKFKGMSPSDAGGKTPPPSDKKPSEMSYEELCAFIENNPGAKL